MDENEKTARVMFDIWKWPKRKKKVIGCLGKNEFLRDVGYDNEIESISIPTERTNFMKGCLDKES
jgi:hypothetical protein